MIILAFFAFVFAIIFSAASLKSRRGDAIGIALVAIGSFAYEYGVQPLVLILSGSLNNILTDWQIAKAMLIATAFLLCFIQGWKYNEKIKIHKVRALWNPRALWQFGLITGIAGCCLFTVFIMRSGGIQQSFSQQHGQGMAWKENTAYLYYGPWWVLSGTAMMLSAGSQVALSRAKLAITYIFPILYIFYAVITGGRGPLFSSFAVVLVSVGLASKRRVSLSRAITVLAVAMVGLMLMLGYRSILYLGEENSAGRPGLIEALSKGTSGGAVDKVNHVTGNEFVYHAAVIDTVDTKHSLSWGLDWFYYITISPIPRLLWAGKSFPSAPGITPEDITEVVGIKIAFGSAPGIVADLYRTFGYFALIFIYWYGRLARHLLILATQSDDPLFRCAYIMLYCVCLHGFAQTFMAIVVPFLYSMIPVVIYSTLSSKRNDTGVRISRARSISLANHVCK